MTTPGAAPPPAPHRYPPSSYAYKPPYAMPHAPLVPVQREAPPAEVETRARPARKFRMRWRPSALPKPQPLTVLLLLVVALAALGWSVRPETPAAPAPQSAAPEPAFVAPLVPALTPRTAVHAWWTSGGRTIIDGLAEELGRVSAAASAGDYSTLRSSCESTRETAEAGQAFTPIPDPQAQQHWAASLAAAARGGTYCLSGVTANYDALFSAAGDAFRTSGREATLARDRINTLGN